MSGLSTWRVRNSYELGTGHVSTYRDSNLMFRVFYGPDAERKAAHDKGPGAHGWPRPPEARAAVRIAFALVGLADAECAAAIVELAALLGRIDTGHRARGWAHPAGADALLAQRWRCSVRTARRLRSARLVGPRGPRPRLRAEQYPTGEHQ